MKRLLIISPDDAVAEQIDDLVDPASTQIDRAASWDDGRDRLIDAQYSATILDSQLLDLAQPREFVQLNDILTKESTRAVVLSRNNADQLAQYIDHLDSFDAPLEATLLDEGRGSQRIHDLLEAAQSLADRSSGASLETSSGTHGQSRIDGPIELSLPPLESGSLEEVSLASLLHGLHLREATGVLTLRTNQMTRRIALRDGDILDAIDDGLASLDQIPPIFAWSNGDYQLEPNLLEGAGLTPVSRVIARGVYDHMDQRRLMNELMAQMDGYVGRTERFEHTIPSGVWEDDIQMFLERADGDTTLETILGSLRSTTRKGFHAAYVALRTHRAVIADRPMRSPIEITIDGEATSEETLDEPSAAGLDPESSTVTTDQPTSPDPERLSELVERAGDANAYELLGAWEGCGRSIVRDRFIPMVKRFHPDRYDQSLSSDQRELAQTLFMRIQEARTSLMEREADQTEPEPTPPPTSVLTDNRANPNKAKPDATQPSTNPNESGVIGLGGRSDVDDFARQMGHRESSSSSESQTSDDIGSRPTQPPGGRSGSSRDRQSSSSSDRRSTDEAIAVGASPGADSDPQSASDQSADTPTDSSSSREADESADGFRDTEEISLGDHSSATLNTDSAPSNTADTNPPDTSERGTRNRRDSRVQNLRKDRSTGDLSGGTSSSASKPKHTPKPSLGSAPTTDKQARNHFNYGYKALKAQREDTALKHLKFAHDFDSDNGLYKTFYGYALFQAQPEMREEAQDLLEEAIDIGHRQALPDAHLFLGRILRVKEEHAKAKRHFKQSLELNPDSKAAQRELRLYEIRDRNNRGDTDAAEQEDQADDPSFKDDPAGYLKNLFNKDLF